MTEKRFKQVVDGVKDTRTGRTLTLMLEFTLKLNEINDLYDCVFDRNEELEKENEQLKQNCKNYNWYKQYKTLLNENKELKKENLDLSEELDYYKTKCASLETGLFQADKENGQLKQELFESEKEWYECHYADNPVRLDSKLEALKEEFKERFGRDFE